jgi:hypothetical protein
MIKKLPMLDEDRPAQSAASDMVAWIASIQVQLPKLSAMGLQSAAFDYYDRSIKPEEPTAAKIAAGIMNLPDLEQRDAAQRRSEWSRSRCVEFLRAQAAVLNKELADVAQRTKSDAVRVAVIDAIYKAILTEYPHLKAEAADMSARQKLKLTKAGKNGAAVSQAPEPVAPIVVSETPKATLAQAKLDAADDAEGDLTQIGHAQLAALRLVHQFVIPAAQASGITVDATQASGLVMNAIIQMFHQRSHFKLPRTRSEVMK